MTKLLVMAFAASIALATGGCASDMKNDETMKKEEMMTKEDMMNKDRMMKK